MFRKTQHGPVKLRLKWWIPPVLDWAADERKYLRTTVYQFCCVLAWARVHAPKTSCYEQNCKNKVEEVAVVLPSVSEDFKRFMFPKASGKLETVWAHLCRNPASCPSDGQTVDPWIPGSLDPWTRRAQYATYWVGSCPHINEQPMTKYLDGISSQLVKLSPFRPCWEFLTSSLLAD